MSGGASRIDRRRQGLRQRPRTAWSRSRTARSRSRRRAARDRRPLGLRQDARCSTPSPGSPRSARGEILLDGDLLCGPGSRGGARRRPRRGVPGQRAVPVAHGARERHLRAEVQRRSLAGRPARRAGAARRAAGLGDVADRYPGELSSGRAAPGRDRAGAVQRAARCCCSTSRSAAWTHFTQLGCTRRCWSSTTAPGSRSSSSPTTSRRPSSSAAACRSMTTRPGPDQGDDRRSTCRARATTGVLTAPRFRELVGASVGRGARRGAAGVRGRRAGDVR